MCKQCLQIVLGDDDGEDKQVIVLVMVAPPASLTHASESEDQRISYSPLCTPPSASTPLPPQLTPFPTETIERKKFLPSVDNFDLF